MTGAVSKVRQFNADVVLLDMNIGEYDGTYAVRKIIKESQHPFLSSAFWTVQTLADL